MAAIARTYTFTDNTTAYGSQVETEVSGIVSAWNNMDAGTTALTAPKASLLTMAGNIVMATNKITGLGNGSAATDGAAFGQIPIITAGQIVGTATNDNATAGNIGQYVSASFPNTIFPAATVSWADITSISLSAGDWDVTGLAIYTLNGGTPTVASTGISTTTGNSSAGLVSGDTSMPFLPPTATANTGSTVSNVRFSLASTTTIYLKHYAEFTGNAPKVYGRISARRVR